MDALHPNMDYITFPVGKRFIIRANGNNLCYFIRNGAVSLYREPNNILFDLIEASSTRDVIHLHSDSYSEYLITVILNAEIAVISKE